MSFYTAEQLNRFVTNAEVFEPIKTILYALVKNKEQTMKEMADDLKMGIYKRDKALVALEFGGFVSKKDIGSAKVYAVTPSGYELYDALNSHKGD